MNIALVAEHGLESILPFSGIPYFMARALHAEADTVHVVECPAFDLELMFANPRDGRAQLQRIGAYVSDRLGALDVDCVICQGSSMLPFLDCKAFVCLWHDSTWQTLLQTPFEEFRFAYPVLYEWDRLALKNASLIAYAADWVREETLRHYAVDAAKLVVAPFGASLFDPPQDSVARSIAARRRSPCRLTFVGVDWIRKGLPAAHSVMQRLNFSGVPTTLNVLGCTLGVSAAPGERPAERLGPRYPFVSADVFSLRVRTDPSVRIWGFVNKDEPSEYHRFCDILRDTHYLIHPAEFECFGVALAEANALGVPILALDAFGPRSIVKPGVNGHLFDAGRFVADASALIASRLENYDAYRLECESSFNEYKNRLNWRANCRKLLATIAAAI